MKTTGGTLTLRGVVRDRNGKVKIDDTDNIPDWLWDELTDSEKQEIENGNTDTSRSGKKLNR